MIGFFKRASTDRAAPLAPLGGAVLARRVQTGAVVPAGCVGVACGKEGVGGRTRRVAAGARITLEAHEAAFCFHPGPYSADLLPFSAAPELGLRLAFVVDSPDPRVAQQRFDVFLASEAGEQVTVAGMGAAMELALQRELAQGHLELPPCTSIDEWNAFRAGMNQLLYTRFGITVDDCMPVDLGEQVDYAAMLRARAHTGDSAPASRPQSGAPVVDVAALDAMAVRRLFLELPAVGSALRQVALPPGPSLFRQHQELLQRLDRISLSAATMPALELEAPGKLLAPALQAARAQHSRHAVRELDEAWALLARLAAMPAAQLFDEADRIVANLELHTAQRRAALPQAEAP